MEMNIKSSKSHIKTIYTLTLIIILAACRIAALGLTCDAGMSTKSHGYGMDPSGCTVITISKGDKVFFGGNDDYINPDSYYWVEPGDSTKYGVIWVGTPDNPQQGVNEKGLAYDANGLPRVDVNPHTERIPVPGGYHNYCMKIMHECSTVEEIITWVNNHQRYPYMHDQLHFADKSGDAVIISAGIDGELVFTRKPRGDGFLVSTNFNVANPSNGYGYPCWRYDKAQELLGQLVNQEGKLTVQEVTNVLDAVHGEGGPSWTIESLVADMPNGLVYLYYFHQFDRPIVLNVEEELANPRAPGPLSKLFPDEVQKEAARRYQLIQERAKRCRWIGMVWLLVVIASVILLIVLSTGGRRGFRFWLPVVIILGPVALLVWLIIGRYRKPSSCRDAVMEAMGDVMPTVIAFLAFLVVILLIPAAQGDRLFQIILIFILPLVVGWLFFHVTLLLHMTEKSYRRFLIQRLPHVLVAANLGMGGMIVVALPLANQSIRICTILPLSVWTVMTWWAIIVLGSLLGGLLLLIYDFWTVRRGFHAWSILAWRQGEVRTPSWRKLWWWILLSYVILLGGLIASIVLLQLLTA
jgi:hypothetical protein